MSDSDYLAIVRAAIAEQRPDLQASADGLSAGASLEDIGLDSLSTVNVLLALSSRFEVDLESAFEGLSPPRTLSDLADIAGSFAERS